MEILKKAELEDMSEFNVRSVAAEKLGMDLSGPEYQKFVRCVIESFLLSMEEEPVAAPTTEEQNEAKESTEEEGKDEYGNAIICKLSKKRKVAVQNYKGTTLVSIREYHVKDGKEFPCPKGGNVTLY
ncbi:Transcriptional coactivator p15 (PC4) [Macleaya cordata]|uniref:Transcriptional coactivator p15 (PC4) n=1 Tax=Macleaya cordata TaxID=56857 RepID=A0A200QCK9_MACCD|nr:Transcriptional coactivator p15 (PC4) [Macleaya cordata]